jgi:hypothetical protein
MNRKTCFAAALLLAAIAPSLARAGIEPSPFDVAIWNRSDLVASDSPHFMQIMYGPKIYAEVQVAGAPMTQVIEIDPGLKGIAPGEGVVLPIDLTQAGGSVVGWGVTAKMGVEPSPFNVCALTAPAPERPTTAPILPATLLSDFTLYAFASPGTPVGEVAISAEALSEPCPPGAAWKNHGQYVRCIALQVSGLTEDEADGIVNAAARSGIGK